jgi:GxxExxY protein
METDKLTERIIGAAIEVHRQLGPGLLESIYESALSIELECAQLAFQRQVTVPIQYRGRPIGEHPLDFIVQNAVVVELKSVERMDPVFAFENHQSQGRTPSQLQFPFAAGCYQEVYPLILLTFVPRWLIFLFRC